MSIFEWSETKGDTKNGDLFRDTHNTPRVLKQYYESLNSGFSFFFVCVRSPLLSSLRKTLVVCFIIHHHPSHIIHSNSNFNNKHQSHVERVAIGVHGKHAEFGRFERSGCGGGRGGVGGRRRARWERRPLWGEDVRETERSCGVVGKSTVVVVVAEYDSYEYESSGRDGRVPRVERERAR